MFPAGAGARAVRPGRSTGGEQHVVRRQFDLDVMNGTDTSRLREGASVEQRPRRDEHSVHLAFEVIQVNSLVNTCSVARLELSFSNGGGLRFIFSL